jgi:hypothetical protein
LKISYYKVSNSRSSLFSIRSQASECLNTFHIAWGCFPQSQNHEYKTYRGTRKRASKDKISKAMPAISTDS